MEEREMGATVLKFEPRESLTDFVKNKAKVSLIRRTGGRKSSENMAIYGENLTALAALKAGFGTAQENFKVNLIVIDPPYNVGGNQGYRNIWKGQSEKERDWAGDHGAFLDFMEPRLKIGRQLLTDDGVIMVNICDGEYCRLKILMDQIFGEENCLGTVIWDKNQGSAGRHLTAVHEYVLVYGKNAREAHPLVKEKPAARMMIAKAAELKKAGLSYFEAQKVFKKWISESEKAGLIGSGESPYKMLHPVSFRPFQSTPSCAHDKPESRSHRKLKHPTTKKPCEVPAKGWKWSEETLLKMADYDENDVVVGDGFVIAGQIVYGTDETTVPRKLQYLDEKMEQSLPSVIKVGYGGQKDLPAGIDFSTPKPVSLIKELIKAYPKKDCRVMDYFGGSGTTAHAVVALNKEDGGTRSWILIEEMGSTYHNILIPRVEYADPSKDFSTYEVETVPVGGKELLKKFNQHSYDFLSSYHLLDESAAIIVEGINIVGVDKHKNQLIAIAIPGARKGKNFFVEELAAIKQTVKKVSAKSVLIYTLHGDTEEPWLGVDKSVLSGTQCKDLSTVGVPDELVKEWSEVLEAMAA
jgi:DNA modification methylase